MLLYHTQWFWGNNYRLFQSTKIKVYLGENGITRHSLWYYSELPTVFTDAYTVCRTLIISSVMANGTWDYAAGFRAE